MSNSVVLGNDLRLLEGSSRLNVIVIRFSSTLLHHPSLLRTFGFSAISTYDSHLPSIFGRNALVFEVVEVK